MPISFDTAAEASSGTLTLGDVADLSQLPENLRGPAKTLPLYRLRHGQREGLFSHAALASRARALMPILNPWLAGHYKGSLLVGSQRTKMGTPHIACGRGGLAKGVTASARVNWATVSIEREVKLLQPATPGRRFFASTSEGDVIAIYCAGEI